MSFRYFVNHNYFAIPTLENSYWAGFIAADGCISIAANRQKRIIIGLNIKDENLLINLKRNIEYTGPIIYRPENKSCLDTRMISGGEVCVLQITSDKLCEDLANIFNIHPRKSLTHEPPISLTFEQELAFIVGYIDGDGSIYLMINRKELTYPLQLSILGTESFLKWVLNVFLKIPNTNYKGKIYPKQKSKISQIMINSKFAYNVLIKLNKINIQKLDRKWNKIQDFENDKLCQL